uniref:Tll0287-like domain-containing protein n=1 Tax=Roseovarius indicus TaxID=540747 RepID=UPI003B52136F
MATDQSGCRAGILFARAALIWRCVRTFCDKLGAIPEFITGACQLRHTVITASMLFCTFIAADRNLASADEAVDIETGNRLASVLRAGRGVISNNQALINDASIGDKGFTGEVFFSAAIEAYLKKNGEHPLDEGLDPESRSMTETQIDAMVEVVDESQEIINADGLAFKGFIPAVFARLANEKFGEEMANRASIKVTAPKELVRNRKARPDEWENEVIVTKFQAADWPVGEAFYEETAVDGKPAFRMLIPEYYSESCLACHGSPKGETDVTGFPKEGGSVGDLAGAISITLYK